MILNKIYVIKIIGTKIIWNKNWNKNYFVYKLE